MQNRNCIISLLVAVGLLCSDALAFATSAGFSVLPFDAWKSAPLPIMRPQGDGFEAMGVYNPTVISRDGQIIMLYRAEDRKRTSRIGYASSVDGRIFRRQKRYVFGPYEKDSYDNTSTEDPRVIKVGRTYYLTYTGYNKKHDLAQLCLATSHDLQSWKRRGVVLPARSANRWDTGWTKSGAILSNKVNGKYWMYYLGERFAANENTNGSPLREMGIAYSKDLIHWSAAIKHPVLATRHGLFDSRVVEPGPPPIMTNAGILVVYNGASASGVDGSYVYATGWALFDKNDPAKLLYRANRPVLTASHAWEKQGTVNNVVFVEGMVRKQHSWTFYYGGGDRVIGIATAKDTFRQ